MKCAWLSVVVFIIGGCADNPHGGRASSGYLCNESAVYDSRLKRLSYEKAPVFRKVGCSKGPDVVHVASIDRLTMNATAIFRHKSSYIETASLQFTIDGNLGRGGLEEFLPPEKFEVFHRESTEYLRRHRLVRTESMKVAGMNCFRFEYSFLNPMRKAKEIEYWCWESVTGVPRPFRVSALEAVSPNEEWQHDLDKEILAPFFASLQLKPVPTEIVARIEKYRQDACSQHKEFFDRTGVGWLAADYPNNRRALVLLKSCGYDVDVPPYDGQALIPTAVRAWD